MWKFSRLKDYGYTSLVHCICCTSLYWGGYSIRARVWSISVVYRVGFFHNLHRIDERGSTLLFYPIPYRSLTD